MQGNHRALPKSNHFYLEQITNGVYVAFSAEGGRAISNAGIIDLGERTLIFDTFETPIAADDLRVASDSLTGRPATWVVNSHFHPDHWFGNQVFPKETIIISSQGTWEGIHEFIDEVEEEKKDPSDLEEELHSLKGQLALESDLRKREVIKSSIARWEFYLESLPNLNLRVPDQTFRGKIELHGSMRSVELIDAGPAHTSGDSYLRIPSENIAFIGDIGFFNEQPYMADSNPEGWKSMLKVLKNSDTKTYIPGQRPAGTKKDLILIQEYIEMLETMVSKAINQRKTVDDVLSQELPEPFRTWSIGSSRMEVNSQFMFEYLSRGE
jgi:glyoxylase-like metal-dependent hydrolase (beta-lactamase superfamily II)